MEYRTLGRTGLKVSVAALGAGGTSRLGAARGLPHAHSIALVHEAIDLGVNLVDTAPTYGTEDLVGDALAGHRDKVIVSTKTRANRPGTPLDSTDYVTATELRDSVENSLRNLKTDRLDLLHLHGIRPHQYDYSKEVLLPEMQRLRHEGKLRFFGITEGFGVDAEHETLRRAVADGDWDVTMGGFNMLNPSAALHLLPECVAANVGYLCMYAVRGALTSMERLEAAMARMLVRGEIQQDADAGKLVTDLRQSGHTLTEIAYRFCSHNAGIGTVLFGTGDRQHLRQNIGWMNRPPLPPGLVGSIHRVFARVRRETGDL
jgi:L-galactose dehydrogenase